MRFPSRRWQTKTCRDDARQGRLRCRMRGHEGKRILPIAGSDNKEYYLGEEAVGKRGVLCLSYPDGISVAAFVMTVFAKVVGARMRQTCDFIVSIAHR